MLQGGSFGGQIAMAPDPPGALRLGVTDGSDHWSEVYLYASGQAAADPEGGTIPVMLFMKRVDDEG